MKTRHAMKIYALTLGVLLLSLSFANLASASSDPKRQYLIGSGFLCTLAPCPDVASAVNGDTVTISGSGWFNPNPSGQAMGGGSFVHQSSTGTVLGFGTWTAEQLISFTPGGFSTLGGVLPAGSQGGIAVLKVHVSPATGGPGFTAILSVGCHLASTFAEGITLNVIGGPNFNTIVSGATLFIKQ